MRLAAVVIWYNPKTVSNLIQNIESYSKFIEKVYIVDNSAENNEELAKKISNAIYIPNNKNLGIATAQNIGCKRAMNDGFDWVLTMDQDSMFAENHFSEYLALADTAFIQDKSACCFAPMIVDPSKQILPVSVLIKSQVKKLLKYTLGKDFSKPKITRPPVEYPERVYASGNIINLTMWNSIGQFDDSLFIDEVDHEFCIRVKLNDFKIVRFNNVSLIHSLGARKRTFFLKCSYHNDFRLFYIFRNKLIVYKRYSKKANIGKIYRREIWGYIRDYCILDFKAAKHWWIFAKAFIAYRKIL